MSGPFFKRTPLLTHLHPRTWAPFAVLLVALGGLWTWGVERFPFLLPPLTDVAQTLRSQPGHLLEAAAGTLGHAMGGLTIGFASAFLLAVVISELPVARRAFMPLAVILNVTPLVAIAPALVVAFGFGPAPKLILTALICFFPILINTATGLRSVNPQVLAVYRTLHASRWEVLRHIRVPSALPHVFAALKIVFPLSVIGAVVAEMSAAGSTAGLGSTILVASSMNRMATIWAAIFLLAIMGSLLLALVSAVERVVLRWHPRG